MSRTVFPPHLTVRDAYDRRIVATYSAVFFPAVLGTVGAVFWGTVAGATWLGNLHPTLGMIAAATGPLLLLSGAFTLMQVSVTHVEIDDEGLHILRQFGRPEFLPWDQIEAVELVDRETLVKEGWLCWPPRDQTRSLTTQGHYRIRHRRGVLFFPPADPERFEQTIRQRLARHIPANQADAFSERVRAARAQADDAWAEVQVGLNRPPRS